MIQELEAYLLSLPDWVIYYSRLAAYLLFQVLSIVWIQQLGRRRITRLETGYPLRFESLWYFLLGGGILWPLSGGMALGMNLTPFKPDGIGYGWELLAAGITSAFLYGYLFQILLILNATLRMPPGTLRKDLLDWVDRKDIQIGRFFGGLGILVGAWIRPSEHEILSIMGLSALFVVMMLAWRLSLRSPGNINATGQVGVQWDEAAGLRLTTLESTIHGLQRLSGRTHFHAIPIYNWRHVTNLFAKADTADSWRRQFARVYRTLWMFESMWFNRLPWTVVQVIPPASMEAVLSQCICGVRRNGLRRLAGLLGAPGRWSLSLVDRIPPNVLDKLIGLPALFVMGILGMSAIPDSPWRIWGVLSVLGMMVGAYLMMTQSRFSAVYGYRVWRRIVRGGTAMEEVEAVAVYITQLAIHEAISRDIRRPEVMVPLMLTDPKIRDDRPLTRAGTEPRAPRNCPVWIGSPA